ncbi:uncharacterized protein LOC119191832 [Manduca sexta]|uniref:uncharacterized protein LOC119191832 n=1 Tax=Manduca sexta TaxID=7130 RepID=UPI00188FDAC2|nr:uncharacterized protein LOC119191832 [Manduca sexta]
MAARRRLARHRRRHSRPPGDDEQERLLHGLHKTAKRALRVAIAQAKAAAREESRRTRQRPVGTPVPHGVEQAPPVGAPLTQSLRADLVTDVVAALFPATQGGHSPPMAPRPSAPSLSIPAEDIPEVSPGARPVAGSRVRSKTRLRGSTVYPDVSGSSLSSHWVRGSVAFSPRALSRALSRRGGRREACPAQERRPAESPSAYRPIVLLDEVCKLFERVVHARLVGHLERIGPDLAACQYGFRRGRSTIHAILRVKALAEDAVARGRVVLAVSLDIANAFNTMPWACINEALRYHEVPPYLRRLVRSYLSDRYVVYPGLGPRAAPVEHRLRLGAPWYQPSGVAVVCYADDTLVTATARTFQRASLLASFGTELVVRRIRRLGLAVALHKTEALAFHGPRSRPPIEAYISVEGVRTPVGSKMKYLGLHLDSRWDFRAHFEALSPKLVRTAGALGRLLPNVEGPGNPCRNLYAGVVRSMALYGSPVWANSLNDRCVRLLRRPQRMVAQRIVRATARSHTKRLAYWRALCPGISTRGLSSVFWWREESLRRGQRLAPQEVETTLVSLRNAAVEEWQLRLESPSEWRGNPVSRPQKAAGSPHEWQWQRNGPSIARRCQKLCGASASDTEEDDSVAGIREAYQSALREERVAEAARAVEEETALQEVRIVAPCPKIAAPKSAKVPTKNLLLEVAENIRHVSKASRNLKGTFVKAQGGCRQAAGARGRALLRGNRETGGHNSLPRAEGDGTGGCLGHPEQNPRGFCGRRPLQGAEGGL